MGKCIDLTGQTFGRWTVIKQAPTLADRNARWICKCSCGNERIVLGKNLRNGRSTSCGCYKDEVSSKQISELNKSRALDLRGQKYGLLTPLEPTEKRLQGSVIWKCLCDCGNITYVAVDSLRGQHPTRSCGCLHQSLGELEIINLLKQNNIEFINQYIFDDLPNKKYDFYLPQLNRLIEFDGEQHYKDVSNWDKVEIQQQRDKIKTNYANQHNIPLVRIPYWERSHITLDMILGDKYLI